MCYMHLIPLDKFQLINMFCKKVHPLLELPLNQPMVSEGTLSQNKSHECTKIN